LDKKLDKELFRKFLKGECSLEEENWIREQLLHLEHDAELQAWMEESWNEVVETPYESNALSSLKKFKSLRNRLRPKSSYPFRIYRIAASIILLISFVSLALIFQDELYDFVSPVHYTTISTRVGEQVQFKLPDGSTVWLNAGSSLTYPEEFRRNRREIRLHGEAFFEVKRDTLKPFIVRTRNFYTKVLGTSFNIKSFDQLGYINVTVLTGRVAVGALDSMDQITSALEYLTPNQQITFHTATAAYSKSMVDGAQLVAWRDGRLSFNGASMHELAVMLEKWFGVAVVLQHNHENACQVTANFAKNTSLRDVLESMKMSGSIEYSAKGRQVIIIPKVCKH
jgi:ferric-dicitrate binding protein FerR (iron transport regulator)